MSTTDLSDTNSSEVVLITQKPRQLNPVALARVYSELNPNALAEIYADDNYKTLKFEELKR